MMRTKYIPLFIFALITFGCQSFKSDMAKELAMINIWASPADPSLAISFLDNGMVVINKYYKGKSETFKVTVSVQQRQALIESAKRAQAEIKNAKSTNTLQGGSNIEIITRNSPDEAVTFKHYSRRYYTMKELPALYDALEKVVPKKCWYD